MKSKKHSGGKRAGAGRPKTADKIKLVRLYFKESVISEIGEENIIDICQNVIKDFQNQKSCQNPDLKNK